MPNIFPPPEWFVGWGCSMWWTAVIFAAVYFGMLFLMSKLNS